MTTESIKERLAPMTPATTQILFVDGQPETVESSKTNASDKPVQSAVALAKTSFAFPNSGRRLAQERREFLQGDVDVAVTRSQPDTYVSQT